MHASDHLALASLSVGRPADPNELFAAAVAGGFTGVGMTARTPDGDWATWAVDDAALQRTRNSALAHGLRILDVGIGVLDTYTSFDDLERLIRTAAALGASHLLVQGWNPDPAHTAGDLARVDQRASESGLITALEFMPYSCVPDLSAAIRLVDMVGTPTVGVLLDVFHHVRSAGTVTQLEAGATRIVLVQLSDGSATPRPRWPLRDEALRDRQYPGLGEFPLAELLARIPASVPISVEAPSLAHAQLPVTEQAATLGQAARAVLNRLRSR